jgi:hypothetical protein
MVQKLGIEKLTRDCTTKDRDRVMLRRSRLRHRLRRRLARLDGHDVARYRQSLQGALLKLLEPQGTVRRISTVKTTVAATKPLREPCGPRVGSHCRIPGFRRSVGIRQAIPAAAGHPPCRRLRRRFWSARRGSPRVLLPTEHRVIGDGSWPSLIEGAIAMITRYLAARSAPLLTELRGGKVEFAERSPPNGERPSLRWGREWSRPPPCSC